MPLTLIILACVNVLLAIALFVYYIVKFSKHAKTADADAKPLAEDLGDVVVIDSLSQPKDDLIISTPEV